MLRRLLPFIVLCGCELAGPPSEAPSFAPPEPPEVDAMRSSTTASDPPAPAAAPILVENDLVALHSPTKRWFLALSKEDRHRVRRVCRMEAANPCWMLPVKSEHPDPDSIHGMIASFEPAVQEHLDQFCRSTTRMRGCNTPLVIAFDDQPVEFTPATDAHFAFGATPVATDWPTAATPWIAIDRDGDGAVSRGAELFGDATMLADGTTATNGFTALATLDANHDGVIDRDDPAFAKLLLWADANADRKSSPDELRALASVVVAIPLSYRLDPRCTNGNCEGERGRVMLRDARAGAVVDVYLRSR